MLSAEDMARAFSPSQRGWLRNFVTPPTPSRKAPPSRVFLVSGLLCRTRRMQASTQPTRYACQQMVSCTRRNYLPILRRTLSFIFNAKTRARTYPQHLNPPPTVLCCYHNMETRCSVIQISHPSDYLPPPLRTNTPDLLR